MQQLQQEQDEAAEHTRAPPAALGVNQISRDFSRTFTFGPACLRKRGRCECLGSTLPLLPVSKHPVPCVPGAVLPRPGCTDTAAFVPPPLGHSFWSSDCPRHERGHLKLVAGAVPA